MPEADFPQRRDRAAIDADPARQRVVVCLEGQGLRGTRMYAWPGDVRELLDVVERAVIQAGGEIAAGTPSADGVPTGADGVATEPAIGAPVTLDLLERRHIEAVLAGSGTLDAAARTLGIDSSTLYRKRKAYGL